MSSLSEGTTTPWRRGRWRHSNTRTEPFLQQSQQPLPQRKEDEVAPKLRRLEHHRDLGDALPLPSFRMEDLPLDIHPLIMSLLSLKEAARTSIVASNWKKLWTCYPNLCFHCSEDCSLDVDSVKIERAKFIETVNSIIQQHNGVALNKFSIRFCLHEKSSDLDRWICFASALKAKIIDIDLWPKVKRVVSKELYNFPIESLVSQGGPFIECLILKDVSIKPHLDICGFSKLRRLRLYLVRINGDLPGMLSKCCALEDLEVFRCHGVVDLTVPHQLNKLNKLLILQGKIHKNKIDFYATGLVHFEYRGDIIPIVLRGCSRLEKVNINFIALESKQFRDELGHAFVPSISAVKVLTVHANMQVHHPFWDLQEYRPTCKFMYLRHLTCEIRIFTDYPDSHNGLLRFAHLLAVAPHLEVVQLHMYYTNDFLGSGEATGDELSSYLGHLHNLKEVYMSGFRCYQSQTMLLCGIVKHGAALEHVTIQPKVEASKFGLVRFYTPPTLPIHRWAHCMSKRFGKVINVVEG